MIWKKNPHYRRMVRLARQSGLEMGQADLDAFRDHPDPKVCLLCGAAAYYKPTVNSYVCACGAVLVRGHWLHSYYPQEGDAL
jgi:hypothetical protein